MRTIILYGTESGNAEMIAEDLVETIGGSSVFARDMREIDLSELSSGVVVLCVCSTHGEGELPSGAVPFAQKLDREQPDFAGMQYAMFGLGDSSYENYSRGSELIDMRLKALGAKRIGPYGRYDAAGVDDPIETARQWVIGVLDRA